MQTDAERIAELEAKLVHSEKVIEALGVVIEAQANVMLAVARHISPKWSPF